MCFIRCRCPFSGADTGKLAKAGLKVIPPDNTMSESLLTGQMIKMIMDQQILKEGKLGNVNVTFPPEFVGFIPGKMSIRFRCHWEQ